MSLVLWGNALLLTNGKLTLGPPADACCCVEGGCGCEFLPDTIWVIVNRSSGDFSDCPAGAFDGDVAELSLVGTDPKEWEGTLSGGYVVHLTCTGQVDNGELPMTVNFLVWVCDGVDEYDYTTYCTKSTGWDDLFLDTSLYPYGFRIFSCDCADGAYIELQFYLTNPV